jgi:hypothetical protein
MQEVIETSGETVEENTVPITERLRPEDIPQEELPVYTVASAIAWMQRPENDRVIRNWADGVKHKWNDMVAAIDRDVSKTGRLLIDMATDDNILEDVKTSFLRSIMGGDD